MFARRLQVQERMTSQIADFMNELLKPRGVAVVVEALHLCSMMRGVKKHDARMTTSAVHGSLGLIWQPEWNSLIIFQGQLNHCIYKQVYRRILAGCFLIQLFFINIAATSSKV